MTKDDEENQPKGDVCARCGGTGLICAHQPEIMPGACCVDYGNATCPDCKGTGKKPVNAES